MTFVIKTNMQIISGVGAAHWTPQFQSTTF